MKRLKKLLVVSFLVGSMFVVGSVGASEITYDQMIHEIGKREIANPDEITVRAYKDVWPTEYLKDKELTWYDIDFGEDKPFINADGRTMVPLRSISEILGAEVTWYGETKTAVITMTVEAFGKKFDVYTSKVQIGNPIMDWEVYNDKREDLSFKELITMDTVPVIVEGRTYVPVRAIAEALNSWVGWDQDRKEITIIEKATAVYHDHVYTKKIIDLIEVKDNILTVSFPELPEGYYYDNDYAYYDHFGEVIVERIWFKDPMWAGGQKPTHILDETRTLKVNLDKTQTIDGQALNLDIVVRNERDSMWGGLTFSYPANKITWSGEKYKVVYK